MTNLSVVFLALNSKILHLAKFIEWDQNRKTIERGIPVDQIIANKHAMITLFWQKLEMTQTHEETCQPKLPTN